MHFYSVGKLFVFWTDIQPTDKISFKQKKMHFKLLHQRCQCMNKYQIQSRCIHKKIVRKYLFFCKKKVYKKNFRAAEG